jgi:hypothetical protein
MRRPYPTDLSDTEWNYNEPRMAAYKSMCVVRNRSRGGQMAEQVTTPLHVALIVESALNMYKEQYPLVGEEIEEIQSAGSAPCLRLKFKSGETFVVDITREPGAHREPPA